MDAHVPSSSKEKAAKAPKGNKMKIRVRRHGLTARPRAAGAAESRRGCGVRAQAEAGNGGIPGGKAARRTFSIAWPLVAFFGLSRQKPVKEDDVEVFKSKDEWRAELPPEAAKVLIDRGTEFAFSSPLYTEKRKGTYACRACGQPLYSSADKFDSGTGWPSFTQPVAPDAITYTVQPVYLLGDLGCREVRCSRCGAHQGHVFTDGPPPTGKRHCINGVALQFAPAEP